MLRVGLVQGAMTDAAQRIYRRANGIIVPLLFVGGILAIILGIANVAIGRFGGTEGLLLLVGGVAAAIVALLLRLLMEIAEHLAVVKTQLK